MPSARNWMIKTIGLPARGSEIRSSIKQIRMIVKRVPAGNEPRLKAEVEDRKFGTLSGFLPHCYFPADFLPIFPNGWADVAEREGFELPKQSPEK